MHNLQAINEMTSGYHVEQKSRREILMKIMRIIWSRVPYLSALSHRYIVKVNKDIHDNLANIISNNGTLK
jgi:hypothetical protein